MTETVLIILELQTIGVQLRAVEHSKIKLSIQRINEEFLREQSENANLSLLLADL